MRGRFANLRADGGQQTHLSVACRPERELKGLEGVPCGSQ
jgi:hypothetical protein